MVKNNCLLITEKNRKNINSYTKTHSRYKIKPKTGTKLEFLFTINLSFSKVLYEITWNLFLTTSSGWQTALAHVPAANPQRNSWKLERESSAWFELEDLDLFQA